MSFPYNMSFKYPAFKLLYKTFFSCNKCGLFTSKPSTLTVGCFNCLKFHVTFFYILQQKKQLKKR